MEKRCPKCLTTDLSKFSKNRSKPDGLATRCKTCQKEMQDDWYNKNRERHIANVRSRNDRVRLINQKNIMEYLATHHCVVCGETDPIVLQFDHVSGIKKAAIAKMVDLDQTWQAIKNEIDKCQVLCANCHSRKTAEDCGFWRWKYINTASKHCGDARDS